MTAALALGGCATSTPTVRDLAAIAPDRQFAFRQPMGETGQLTILRASAFPGSAVDLRVLIDGALAAQLGNGEHLTLHVPAGERIIEIRHPSDVFGAVPDSAVLQVSAGQRYYYRINMDLGSMRLQRTTEASSQ